MTEHLTEAAKRIVRSTAASDWRNGAIGDAAFVAAIVEEFRAALPEGSVVAPREPTRKMCLAAREAQASWPIRDEADSPVVVYRAMIAAATEDAR